LTGNEKKFFLNLDEGTVVDDAGNIGTSAMTQPANGQIMPTGHGIPFSGDDAEKTLSNRRHGIVIRSVDNKDICPVSKKNPFKCKGCHAANKKRNSHGIYMLNGVPCCGLLEQQVGNCNICRQQWEDFREAEHRQKKAEAREQSQQRKQAKQFASDEKKWRSDLPYKPRTRSSTKKAKDSTDSSSNEEHGPKKSNNMYHSKISGVVEKTRELVEYPKLQKILNVTVLDETTSISGEYSLVMDSIKPMTKYVEKNVKNKKHTQKKEKIYHPKIKDEVLHDCDKLPYTSLTIIHPSSHPTAVYSQDRKALNTTIVKLVRGMSLKQGKGTFNRSS